MKVSSNLEFDIEKLTKGKIAEKDIIVDDKILVKKGAILTEEIIKKLQNEYLENPIFHELYKESSLKDVTCNLDEVEQEIKKREEILLDEVIVKVQKYTEEMKDIFEKLDSSNIPNMIEIRNFSEKILEELTSPRMAVKNIVLYGSGNDSVFKHSVNVTILSVLLGKWLNFDDEKLSCLMRAALLHDFGKYKIQEILDKEEELNEDEFRAIRQHPVVAYNLIQNLSYVNDDIKLGILMHHERLDGSGYPLKRKDNQINDIARIIAIADTFDGVNSKRNYKPKKDLFEALETIREEGIEKLDYKYCNVFIEHIINYYIGEYILFNNNKVAKIIQIDVNNLSAPLLLCEDKFLDIRKHKELKIEKIL